MLELTDVEPQPDAQCPCGSGLEFQSCCKKRYKEHDTKNVYKLLHRGKASEALKMAREGITCYILCLKNWFAYMDLSLLKVLLFVLISVAAFLITVTPSSNPYDYPFYIISADRVLHGEMPYVDFSVVYGPLGYYVNAAGLFALSFLPLIPAFCVFSFLIVFGYFLFLMREKNRFLANKPWESRMLTLYLITFLPILAHYAFYSLIPELMLVVSIRWAENYFSSKYAFPVVNALLLAAMTVIAVLTRINIGFYIFTALMAVSLLSVLFGGMRSVPSMKPFLIGLCFFGLIAAGILWTSGILIPYVTDILLFLPRYQARHLPLTHSTSPFQLLLLIELLAVILCIAADMIRRKLMGAGLVGILILLCLYQYCFQRLDIEHVYSVLVVLPFVYFTIREDYGRNSYALEKGSNQSRDFQSRIPSLLSYAFLGLMLAMPMMYLENSVKIVLETSAYVTDRMANHHSLLDTGIDILPSEQKMLGDLEVESGGRDIFWGSMPGSCESSTQVGANLSLYLAQNRLPKTRIWYFDPCSTAHADIQQILVNELEAKHLRMIAIQGLIDPKIGYLPGNPPESRIFYDYVRRDFILQKRYTMPEANRYYDIYVRVGPNLN